MPTTTTSTATFAPPAPGRGLLPRPAGFGRCAVCAFAEGGAAAVCLGCAGESVARPLGGSRCGVCDLPVDGVWCPNAVCGWAQRGFGTARSIFMHSDQLRWALHRYKARGNRAWAAVFARMLVAYVRERRRELEPPDLLVAAPTYIGPGGRTWDHTGLVLAHAAPGLGRLWPVAGGVIVRTRPAAALRFARSRAERHRIACEEIRPSLHVPDPARVSGRRIVVFDDVFTEGLTLHETGLALDRAGALSVDGIALARQPFAGA